MLDQKKLAVIHITKKELDLDDQPYRDILEKVAGVRSSRDLDEAGFRKLMRYFARSGYYRTHREGMTFRQRLYIRHLVEDLGWDPTHFANFLQKYFHREELAGLSKKEAGNIIESLKNILARRFGTP